MWKIRVLEPIGFNVPEVLQLSADQAKARAHVLRPLGGGRFEVTGRVEFKKGEELGLAAEPAKGLGQRIEVLEGPPRRGRAAEKDV